MDKITSELAEIKDWFDAVVEFGASLKEKGLDKNLPKKEWDKLNEAGQALASAYLRDAQLHAQSRRQSQKSEIRLAELSKNVSTGKTRETVATKMNKIKDDKSDILIFRLPVHQDDEGKIRYIGTAHSYPVAEAIIRKSMGEEFYREDFIIRRAIENEVIA